MRVTLVLLLCLLSSYCYSALKPQMMARNSLSSLDSDEPRCIHKGAVATSDEHSLSDYLMKKFQVKRTQVRQWLTYGAITVNNEIQTKHDFELRNGDYIMIVNTKGKAGSRPPVTNKPQALPTGMRIIYEDDAILVIEKPVDMPTSVSDTSSNKIATKTALHYINSILGKRKSSSKAIVIHKLEDEISGLVIFAKTISVKDTLMSQWETFGRTYVSLVIGKLQPPQGCMKSLYDDSDKNMIKCSPYTENNKLRVAVSNYRTIAASEHYSLVEFSLETNRKDQLRAQLVSQNVSIVGDNKYVVPQTQADKDPLRRIGIHFSEMRITHPVTREPMTFKSAVPPSFVDFIKRQNGLQAANIAVVNDKIDEEATEAYNNRNKNIKIVKLEEYLGKK